MVSLGPKKRQEKMSASSALFVCVALVLMLVAISLGSSKSSEATDNKEDRAEAYNVKAAEKYGYSGKGAQGSSPEARPGAWVDGQFYSQPEQIDALTGAARDAGYDEPTAREIGRDAAILCNGDPDCLR